MLLYAIRQGDVGRLSPKLGGPPLGAGTGTAPSITTTSFNVEGCTTPPCQALENAPAPNLKSALYACVVLYRKVDVRLPGKGNSKLPWREAGPLNHLDDVVDSDQ